MIGALFNGVSGINSFERAISVESNNVSNTTTVGHKYDTVTFEDVMYKKGFGKGVNVQQIQKNFNQGDLQLTTKSALDVALEGKGFFITSERKTGDIFYTRAGNFQQAEDGFLETQENFKVLGLSPQRINLVSTNATDTMFTNDFNQYIISKNLNNTESEKRLNQFGKEINYITKQEVYNINAKTTDFYKSAVDDTNSGSNSKTASSKINDVEYLKNDFINKLGLLESNFSSTSTPSTTQISQINYTNQLSQLNDKNDFIKVVIDGKEYREYFDTDALTTLKNLSDKISNTQGFTSSVDDVNGTLLIEGLVPGDDFFIYEANINDNYISVQNLQDATLGSGISMLNSSRDALKNAVEKAGAKYLEITNVLNYDDNSVIGNDEINLRLNALGFVENEMGTVSISDDGFVYVTSDNNKFLISKLQTAAFRNEQGLKAMGSNIYQKTDESGNPFNGNSLNKVVSNALESGNSTYNNSLSRILFYQKAFEASSKSITVSDEFLQTAIEMKK